MARAADPVTTRWLHQPVPDPSEPATFTVTSACVSEVETAPLVDGVARLAHVAPPGASRGLTVSVEALNAGDACAVAAGADTADTAAIECEDADTGEPGDGPETGDRGLAVGTGAAGVRRWEMPAALALLLEASRRRGRLATTGHP